MQKSRKIAELRQKVTGLAQPTIRFPAHLLFPAKRPFSQQCLFADDRRVDIGLTVDDLVFTLSLEMMSARQGCLRQHFFRIGQMLMQQELIR